MEEYYLDANAHSKSNISYEQFSKLNFDIGIHGNPMSPNLIGRKASKIIEDAREKIAKLLNAPSSRCIFFMHSCTEANNLACKIIGEYCNYKRKYYKSSNKLQYFTLNQSPFEHKSISDATNQLLAHRNFISLNKDGSIKHITNSDISIYVGVQSEIGLIADFEKIRQNTKKIFFSDLAQAVGRLPIDLQRMGIDIATFAPHKYGGISGVGILYLKDPAMIELNNPMYYGGQYNYDIPGSPNTFAIACAAVGMENALNNIINSSFQKTIENRLIDMGFEIIGKDGNRIITTTLAKVPKISGLELLGKLSEKNIFVGLGSACGSMNEQSSQSTKALGYNDLNTSYIRISHNGEYSDKDANYIADIIEEILGEK